MSDSTRTPEARAVSRAMREARKLKNATHTTRPLSRRAVTR